MYTQELINEVKSLYPNSTEMHKLAESGNAFLGRYLDDNSPNSISIKDVLLATSLDELQREARKMLRKVNLYQEWCKQDPRPKISTY